MCGIAGIILPILQNFSTKQLKLFSDELEHRGPDDHGYYAWNINSGEAKSSREINALPSKANVGFVHRRLSILDLSENGWQPMSDESGTYHIVFNGEIYNFIEIREELQKNGISFNTSSDTEVLLKALIHWGLKKTLPRLVGMFAFAFLNKTLRQVSFARDPFGIKPLYLSLFKSGLVFASEITALLRLSEIPRKLNPQSAYNYLRFGLSDKGDQTFFSGIQTLEPAHFVRYSFGDHFKLLEKEKYWSPNTLIDNDITFHEATTKLRILFEKSIQLHLRSDVQIGVTLSGGLDSSAIVTTINKLTGSNRQLNTFSFSSPGTPLNEAHWADIAAKAVDAKIHKTTINEDAFQAQIDGLIYRQAEPFRSTSIFAQNKIFDLVHQNQIKVTIDGQGADELLAGYLPFLSARLATLLSQNRFIEALKMFRHLPNKRNTFLETVRFILPDYLEGIARKSTGRNLCPEWLNQKWFLDRDVQIQSPQKNLKGDKLHAELISSLQDRILPALLRYQDRNSMDYSIESRVPFLTTELADFIYSLPESFLISEQGQTKHIFREALSDVIPKPILMRKDKIGLQTDENKILESAKPWISKTFKHANSNLKLELFQKDIFQDKFRKSLEANDYISTPTWRWINLMSWATQFEIDEF